MRAAVEAGEMIEAQGLAVDRESRVSKSPVMRRVVRFQVATLCREDLMIATPSKKTGAKFTHFWSVNRPFSTSARHRW